MLHRAGLIAALLIALMMLVFPVSAQDAPAAVTSALNALNAQLGTTLTLTDLANWQWSQQNFPDRSLGCPQEGYTYAQFATNGTIVTLVYNGITYDFRVYTSDLQVFQCSPTSGAPGGTPDPSVGQTSLPTTTPPPAVLTSTPVSVPVTGSVVCAGGLPTQMAVGVRGVSIANGSINIRNPADLDDSNAVKGLLLPGGEFEVIGGPLCEDNRTWWQIRYESAVALVEGWVIEGDNVDYWLEPLGNTPQPVDPVPVVSAPSDARVAITPANAEQIKLYTRIPVQEGIAQLAFLPGGSLDAILIDPAGDMHYYAGANVVRVDVSLRHVGLLAQYVTVGPRDQSAVLVASLERDPNLASGTSLYTAELSTTSPLIVTGQAGFQLPYTPNALAINADGTLLAASSGVLPGTVLNAVPNADPAPNLVWLWDTSSWQQLPAIQLDGPAADLVFSPDGRYLAITQPDVGVHLWSLGTASEVTLLFSAPNWHGTQSLAFSPDGALLAVGTTDGKVILYDLTDPATVQPRA